MALVLTPSPPLEYARLRLRQSLIEESFMGDSDLLELLNDGYQAAMEESQANVALTTMTLTDGQVEYALPGDWTRTLHVYANGRPLDLLPDRNAFLDQYGTGVLTHYYQYEGIIGFNPAPTSDTDTAVILYVQSPDAATSFTDDLNANFTPEWWHLLRHYGAWQALLLSGGAQRMAEALFEKQEYDRAVQGLRNSGRLVTRGNVDPIPTLEGYRYKRPFSDPSVDAR